MQVIYDALVDYGDDVIINGDIVTESNVLTNVMNCIQRRTSARQDDFFFDDICAAIETFIGSTNIDIAKYAIEENIRSALTKNNLLAQSEFDVFLLDPTADGKLPVIIKLKFPFDNAELEKLGTFKVFVNLKNQRAYK